MLASDINKPCLSEGVAQELLEFSTPFLKKVETVCFGYDRVYFDGSCHRFTPYPKVVHALMEPDHLITHPSALEILQNRKKGFIFMPEGDKKAPNFLSFKKRFLLGTGVEFFEINEDYFEQFWFFTRSDFCTSANIYVNHLEEMDQFITRLKERSLEWIQRFSKDRIVLPRQVRGDLGSFKLVGERLFRERKRSYSHLTKRDIECIALVSAGLTSLEISRFLDLSVRTVEHRVDRIKDKLDCSKKSQIAAIALKLQADPLLLSEFKDTIKRYSCSKNGLSEFIGS